MNLLTLFLIIMSLSYFSLANPQFYRRQNYNCGSSKIKNFMFLGAVWQSNMHVGGSVLIKPNVALTAAHVIRYDDEDLYSVRFGSDCKDSGGQVYNVKKSYKHEDYKGYWEKDNDIALLHLESEVNIDSITTLSYAGNWESFQGGMSAWVVGWGQNSHLVSTNVYITDFEACRRKYNNIRWEPIAITDNMICAGGGDADSCKGDSGGPLLIMQNFEYYLIGLVSFGKGCKDPKYPGVYTKVSNYEEWIDDKLDVIRNNNNNYRYY